jgi:hypothetical protein
MNLRRILKTTAIGGILFVLITACRTIETASHTTVEDNNSEITFNTGIENRTSEDSELTHMIETFIGIVNNEDSILFKEMMDKDGIFSITYYVDGRDRNSVVHVNQDEVRDDLVLANSNKKAGITVGILDFAKDTELRKDIPINQIDKLNDISFDVDWREESEDDIQKRLEDIYQACSQIIRLNNQYIPQVFILKDHYVVLTKSIASEEPVADFIGDWAIFEKVEGRYKLRVLMNFQ